MEGDEALSDAIDVAATRAREPERRPYRPVPRDFVERWPSVGWTSAELEWRANGRTIARWIDECGRDAMILARKGYLQAEREVRSRLRRKRYVMGRTMTPANSQSAGATTSAAENRPVVRQKRTTDNVCTHHEPEPVC